MDVKTIIQIYKISENKYSFAYYFFRFSTSVICVNNETIFIESSENYMTSTDFHISVQ